MQYYTLHKIMKTKKNPSSQSSQSIVLRRLVTFPLQTAKLTFRAEKPSALRTQDAMITTYSLVTDSRNVIFVIISQPEPYHASVAMRLKQNIETQVQQLEDVGIVYLLSMTYLLISMTQFEGKVGSRVVEIVGVEPQLLSECFSRKMLNSQNDFRVLYFAKCIFLQMLL